MWCTVWRQTKTRNSPAQRTDRMCPALPGSWVHPRPASISFPKSGCFKAGLHSITAESFTLPLLNNWPSWRQKCSSPNTTGLVPHLQGDLCLPVQGEQWGVDLPRPKGHRLEWRDKAAPWKGCLRSKGSYWIPASQGKMRIRLPPRRGWSQGGGAWS